VAEVPTPLEEALGYTFTDRVLLQRALTHRSHDPEGSNERLEFLGDAVLEFVVTSYLYAESGLNEGEMTKVRISVVNQAALEELARGLTVGEAVLLDAGEEVTGGREKASILADTLEALLGAIYLDGGLDEARRVVLAHWVPIIEQRVEEPGESDSKSRLQEVLAQLGLQPAYAAEGEGPDHARVFFATVSASGRVLGSGMGTSKKAAEQAAARQALDAVRGEGEGEADA
jgi:ribonuclease-3